MRTHETGIDFKVILKGPTRNKWQVGTEFIWLKLGSNGWL